VLDDVERRGFLVQPAGENAVPPPVRLLHIDLDESAGQLLLFPGSRRLAGAQPHDHIFPPDRLAGMQRNRLHDAIALVEDAEHRDALRHGRHAALPSRGRGNLSRTWSGCILLLPALAAGGKRERDQQRCGSRLHAYSGIQGW
jgi:hypothetical protein